VVRSLLFEVVFIALRNNILKLLLGNAFLVQGSENAPKPNCI